MIEYIFSLWSEPCWVLHLTFLLKLNTGKKWILPHHYLWKFHVINWKSLPLFIIILIKIEKVETTITYLIVGIVKETYSWFWKTNTLFYTKINIIILFIYKTEIALCISANDNVYISQLQCSSHDNIIPL